LEAHLRVRQSKELDKSLPQIPVAPFQLPQILLLERYTSSHARTVCPAPIATSRNMRISQDSQTNLVANLEERKRGSKPRINENLGLYGQDQLR
ncbi:hypothetical protein HAX54_044934, partial [Datura stramonium]|nr:hypothetical protein [Datura stramonium]